MTKLRPVIGTHRALSSGTRSSDAGMDSGGTDRTSHLPLFSADESGGLHSSTSGHIPPSLLRDMQTGPPRSEDLCSRLGTNLLSIFFFSPSTIVEGLLWITVSLSCYLRDPITGWAVQSASYRSILRALKDPVP
jgi:hypothetical protein